MPLEHTDVCHPNSEPSVKPLCHPGSIWDESVWPDWAILEFLGNKFTTNVAQMAGDSLGSCENHHLWSQTGEATFSDNL